MWRRASYYVVSRQKVNVHTAVSQVIGLPNSWDAIVVVFREQTFETVDGEVAGALKYRYNASRGPIVRC